MPYFFKLYLAAFGTFLLMDGIWLGVVARGFYKKHLGYLLAENPNWLAAGVFYLLFIAGLVTFAVIPSVQSGSLLKAGLMGGFFGLVSYATYDLTNHATVKNWPAIVSYIDITWGFVLSATVTMVGYLVGSRISH
jgi:uncharacterized membrane protein